MNMVKENKPRNKKNYFNLKNKIKTTEEEKKKIAIILLTYHYIFLMTFFFNMLMSSLDIFNVD